MKNLVELKRIAEISAGGGAPQEASAFCTNDEGKPFIRAGSLPKLLNGESERTLEHLTEETAKSYRLRLFPEETILFAKSGMSATKGHIYQLTQPSYVVNHLAAIVPNENLFPPYLKYWFQQNPPSRLIKDEAYPSIRLSEISEIKIPLPPLDEQKRIAAVLDKADTVREFRRHAVKKLNELLQSVFLDMFGDPFYNKDNSMVHFGTLVNRITYGFTCPMKHLESGIPIITAKNVQSGFIDFKNIHYADKMEFDELTGKSKPKQGDILITKDGTIGRCAVVDVDFPICINQSVALLETDATKASPTYLVGYLNSPSVQRVLKGMGKGNALQHLQITELAKLPTHYPTLEEQQIYSAKVGKIKEIKKRLESTEKKSNSLFHSLQQRAFAGELFGADGLVKEAKTKAYFDSATPEKKK